MIVGRVEDVRDDPWGVCVLASIPHSLSGLSIGMKGYKTWYSWKVCELLSRGSILIVSGFLAMWTGIKVGETPSVHHTRVDAAIVTFNFNPWKECHVRANFLERNSSALKASGMSLNTSSVRPCLIWYANARSSRLSSSVKYDSIYYWVSTLLTYISEATMLTGFC